MTRLKGENLKGYVKIARDLTGHKRLHEEQNQQLAETQISSHLKDEFFAVMSHELKHPLNLIQLNAELLRRLPVTKSLAPAAKAVDTICDAVNSQARIINDLLDVARLRTGKLKLKLAAMDVCQVLQDIHAVVSDDAAGINVTLRLPDAGQPLTIDADPTRVEQIIWNLVNNALKFTPAGGQVQLVASREGDMARLEVKDRGAGLSAQSISEVIELIGQAANQHATHQRDGLGIGLWLVRQLAEAHGGSVEVSSAGLGQGCTFTVLLPLSQSAEDTARPAPTDGLSGRLAGVTVLLVDDSAEVLETLQMLLEMEDARVIAFSEPVKALKAAQTGQYDLVISDVGMPVMSGHELMRALRELPQIQAVPAIALTGYGAESDIEESRKSGFDRHLSKPVSYELLIETIEELRSALLK